MGAMPIALEPLILHEQIRKRVGELALQLDSLYGESPLVAVCVLKGACMFFADLVRGLRNPSVELDFVRLSSYGDSTSRARHVTLGKDVEVNMADKHVLIVEDIVDTGHSMRFLVDQFAARRPASLRIACLIDKAERREVDVPVAFSCFAVPRGFLVGYGLDYGERYRNLPDICTLCFQPDS